MSQPFKDAVGLCKTIMRNGYDAYVINARLQKSFLAQTGAELAMDISTELDFEGLKRLFPNVETCNEPGVVGFLRQGGNKVQLRLALQQPGHLAVGVEVVVGA